MRKIFIIWNPASGGKSSKIVRRLTESLGSDQTNYVVADTSESKNAKTPVAQQLDPSFTDLIIVGGDGTINEAINGLKYDIPVSIIPAGTGDDFAKMVELGKTLNDQLDNAINGQEMSIDLGICNERKFINGIGVGFDGQIVEDMITMRVPLLKGHAAYYYHVLRILGGYKEKAFDFKIGEKAVQKELILLTIGNGTTFGGGFKLMPEAKIDDGLFEVCEIGKLSGFRRFLNIHKLSNGSHGSLNTVNFYRTDRVFVNENPLLFGHIDGERLGNPPFDIRVLPKAIRLRVRP